MDLLMSPFVRLWDWVQQVGGFPGQVFFICVITIGILGFLTWLGNKR